MEIRPALSRRTMSVSEENKCFPVFQSKKREIVRAINNRSPDSLISLNFTRKSVSPTNRPIGQIDSSIQLLMLKHSVDKQKLSVNKGDKNLSVLKENLKQLEIEDIKRTFWNKQLSNKIQFLRESIEKSLLSQSFELNNQKNYLHILDRMKNTKLHLKMQSTNLSTTLDNTEILLSSEKKKKLLTQEAVFQAFQIYKEFHCNVTSETDEGSTQVYELQKTLEKNQAISARKEEWKRFQISMYEAAAIDDKALKCMDLKENILLLRLWFDVLIKLFERKKEKSKKIEEAFREIRSHTGLGDVTEIIEKFLSKEELCSSLMRTVKIRENECSDYNKKIKKLQVQVNEVLNKENLVGDISTEREIHTQLYHDVLDASQKRIMVQSTHRKVRDWAGMMIKKLDGVVKNKNLRNFDGKDLVWYINEIKIAGKNALVNGVCTNANAFNTFATRGKSIGANASSISSSPKNRTSKRSSLGFNPSRFSS